MELRGNAVHELLGAVIRPRLLKRRILIEQVEMHASLDIQ